MINTKKILYVLQYQVYILVCVYTCGYRCMTVCVHMEIRGPHQVSSSISSQPYFLQRVSLTKPWAHKLVRLDGQQGHASSYLHHLSTGITGVCCHIQPFNNSARDLNSGPQVCAKPLWPSHFPSPKHLIFNVKINKYISLICKYDFILIQNKTMHTNGLW